jgi:DNA (cytosine-5)-methyltransferase 1
MFCGAGGLALGLHQAGFRPTALLEMNKFSCWTIKDNISRGFFGLEERNVIQADVRDINYADFGSKVQFISGGPTFQPFSLGGQHKAQADARDMFPEAVRAVREIRPLGFIFENVKGLLRASFRSYFNYIILQLSYPEVTINQNNSWVDHLKALEKRQANGANDSLEYRVTFHLVNAVDYGAPQKRQRVIIVGFRRDLDVNWEFPPPTHSEDSLNYAKYGDGSYWEERRIPQRQRPPKKPFVKAMAISLPRWRTVRDALADLPDPRTKEAKLFYNHEYRAGAKPYPGHLGSVLDEPSKTIKAGVHGVPGGENTLILDDGSIRYYTVRESARIQTFPDNYFFQGSWTESMRQIGNAVPVNLATAIGRSVAGQLNRAVKLHLLD